ncbi:MAG: hypothetical protein FIB01_05730 [Gemmatimonadetes bacterium]|nr:hypothetical protein [Gemmatimonadota bacterium]
MNHAAEGLLQAYLDGEATGRAAAEIDGHIAGCEECRAELERMRSRSLLVSSALKRLDQPALETAPAQAWWRMQARARRPGEQLRGRFTIGALTRAAAILLVCAGTLAALPGSPVRKLLTRLFEDAAPPVRVTPPTPAATAPSKTVPAPAAPGRVALPGVTLAPSEGRVRVLVWSAQRGATIRVTLVEGDRVSVEAGSDAEDVRFRTGRGRIEVMNLGSAEAVIRIPRSLRSASLDVDGRQWLYKDGDRLRVSGPVVEQSPDAVVFRAN